MTESASAPDETEAEGVDPGAAPLRGDAPGLFTGETAGIVMPPWLIEGPPTTEPFKWPGGAFSPTWFKMIQECPYKHAEVYRRKIKDQGGEDADVGTACHEALEWAAVRRLKRTWRDLPRRAGTEELLHLLEFNEQARKSTAVLDRARVVLQGLGPVDFGQTIAAETILQLRLSHDVNVAAIADMVTATGDPATGYDEITVYDYKSGEYVPDDVELFYDIQAQVNVIAARRKWPRARRVVFTIWNIQHNELRTLPYSGRLEETFHAAARAAVNTWRLKDESANPGKNHCTYCHVRTRCEPLKKWYDTQRRRDFPSDMKHLPIEEKVFLYRDMQLLNKLSEQRRKDLGPMIEAEIPKDMKSYRVGRLNALRKRNSFTAWNDEIMAILEMAQAASVDFVQLLRDVSGGIGEGKLKAWVSGLPAGVKERVQEVIDRRSRKASGTEYLEVRESKTKALF